MKGQALVVRNGKNLSTEMLSKLEPVLKTVRKNIGILARFMDLSNSCSPFMLSELGRKKANCSRSLGIRGVSKR